MSEPDLNILRSTLHDGQRTGNVKPREPKNKVLVDNEGGIHVGEDRQTQQNPQAVSEVQQDTFESRLTTDRRTVKTKLPANTKEFKTSEGVTGWVYCFSCELGTRYKMFLYFDGSNYQVKVIEPRVENYWHDPHTGHLMGNGNICFGAHYGAGRPSIGAAYAKSVLWATGMSIAIKTGTFPWNHNQ